MSAWMEVKALRAPADSLGFAGDLWELCEANETLPEFDPGEDPERPLPHFQPAPTLGEFLDYVLYESVTEKRGGFGKTRALKETEKKKYLPLFIKFFPDIDTEKIRYVHYVFYDGCEAPDYYD